MTREMRERKGKKNGRFSTFQKKKRNYISFALFKKKEL